MDERNLNLQLFTERRMRGEAGPRLSIQRRGNASVNKATVQALGTPEAVNLFFDEKQRVIGLQSATKDSPHAYPLRKTAKSETYVLSLASVLRRLNVDLDSVRGRYPGVAYKDMLVFDLAQPEKQEGTS